jgi:poly(hydroxyalkanoate) granule-associated protein
MILDPAINVARKSALVYIGAIALTGDRLTQTFDQLAQRGEQIQNSARERLRQVTSEARRMVRRDLAEGQEQIEETSDLITQGRDRLMDALNIPTQTSMTKLNYEVARLSAQIDELRETTRRNKAQAKAQATAISEPIPGYEKMNVETVIAELPAHPEATLLAVQAYEQQHANRITVLRAVERTLVNKRVRRGALHKLDGLTTVEPLPRYGELRAEEIVERTSVLSEEELLHVRAYEQDHQARITVLRVIEQRLGAKVEA